MVKASSLMGLEMYIQATSLRALSKEKVEWISKLLEMSMKGISTKIK
jgi:hypothetical protein